MFPLLLKCREVPCSILKRNALLAPGRLDYVVEVKNTPYIDLDLTEICHETRITDIHSTNRFSTFSYLSQSFHVTFVNFPSADGEAGVFAKGNGTLSPKTLRAAGRAGP